jgi:uncharacterized membrane protein
MPFWRRVSNTLSLWGLGGKEEVIRPGLQDDMNQRSAEREKRLENLKSSSPDKMNASRILARHEERSTARDNKKS